MVNDDPNLLFLDGTLDTEWILDIQKQQHIYASKAIKEIQNIFEQHGCNVYKTSILTGNPSHEIINYAKENMIDLIVLGSQNKSRLDRFLTGSVSKRVLENVVSDIWLARCKKIDE